MNELGLDQFYCENCGKIIQQNEKGRSRRFCSGKCRTAAFRLRIVDDGLFYGDIETEKTDVAVAEAKKSKDATPIVADDPVPDNGESPIDAATENKEADHTGATSRDESTANDGASQNLAVYSICSYCGKRYAPVKLSKQKYCSDECYIAANTESNNRIIVKEDRAFYDGNPYVVFLSLRKVELTDSFFCAAWPLLDLEVDEILKIFEVLPRNFSPRDKQHIRRLISDKAKISAKATECYPVNDICLRIMANRIKAMKKIVEQALRSISDHIKDMTRGDRKELCYLLRDFSKEPLTPFTITRMVDLVGISRNPYYCYIRNEYYGVHMEIRDEKDEHDVRIAFEYKGYPKGVRQVYMLIPKVCGRKIGLDRVRYIMRKYGMKSDVRKPNAYRRSQIDTLDEHRKPNLLRRMFRLHRPNEVRLTDVTVIECANDFKAYGAAFMDPVTGVVTAFEVSETNNIVLAQDTLHKADSHPCKNGGIIHSDQGSVYLSTAYQQEIEALGFKQSMSKRGNCWDNAPQESFFGHFKDECRDKYEVCENIEDLRKVIDDYLFYYNNERGQWDRKHMTPMEYEAYLLSLSKEEIAAYMEKETEKYEKMKEEAKQKAIERYKTLGV